MKNSRIFGLAFAVGLGAATAQAQVNVNIYSGHGTTDGGAPYSGLVGSLNSPDIKFGTDTGFAWHPFGLSDFGADLTGFLNVSANSTYSFDLVSDDGSLLFIDGSLVVDDGGPHGVTAVANSVALTPGLHPFEVQFFEDFFGTSGVDLNLPTGVTYANGTVPDATATFPLLGGALTLLGLARKLRRQP